MRLLDPNLLTADIGKIMVRDNAIVFAMEHIRLIISATTVIIPRDGFEQNLLNSRFNALLEESIIEAAQDKAHREARVAQLREIAESDIEDDGASSGRQRHDSIVVTSAESCIGLPSCRCTAFADDYTEARQKAWSCVIKALRTSKHCLPHWRLSCLRWFVSST